MRSPAAVSATIPVAPLASSDPSVPTLYWDSWDSTACGTNEIRHPLLTSTEVVRFEGPAIGYFPGNVLNIPCFERRQLLVLNPELRQRFRQTDRVSAA